MVAVLPISQAAKVRHREDETHVQSHTAYKWQSLDSLTHIALGGNGCIAIAGQG